ncbi:phosphatidylinositol phosphate synthase [Streptomyces boncukensis]|uniref:Phosphatidylinositol phosphate synthase n=1 Tax=Streptomyces boncukensis TaxID=2711219 RepID=A0A6G4WT71_9ACTN|nr:CDP-alcohol phosphatidyltransferase family protein [Streptomyces boncukensis]NGO68042.1 CDP-alcohol phosphatidyltransferase family protein [Streptomyces boncukensis]
MLNKYARAFFTRVLTPFAAFLLRRGVSPDAVTLVGTGGVVAGALVFYPRGEFFWGTVVITLFVFSDLVDGTMARQLGRSSRWGAFLDSTLDRVADAAVFGGIAMWYAGRGDDPVLCAVTLFCLASGQVVSYTKARGESIGLPVKVNGLVERAERLVITLVLAGFAGFERTFGVPHIGVLLPLALWVVAAGSAVTLGQRVVTVRREAAEADAEPGPGNQDGGAGGDGGADSAGDGGAGSESGAAAEGRTA